LRLSSARMLNTLPNRMMANWINGNSQVQQVEEYQKSVQQKEGYL